MILERIITLASAETRLEFSAMERSLRATGCKLPLWVIPYNDTRFELPELSEWWFDEKLCSLLMRENAHPSMRKYQCLSAKNYQYVDTDVCFLRNPETALRMLSGCITSCGHWHNPDHTLTDLSKRMLSEKSTTWQSKVFNTGQFACDQQLYPADELAKAIFDSRWSSVTVHWPHNEQPGLNLLVSLSGVPVTNLTLPPHEMQSTWAGDYPGEFRRYWNNETATPYLIHWAGMACSGARPIDELFRAFLTVSEREALDRRMQRSAWGFMGRMFRKAGSRGMRRRELSVIVPTFRRTAELFYCLDCLAPDVQGIHAEDYEILVGDDAADENLRAELARRYPAVRYVPAPGRDPRRTGTHVQNSPRADCSCLPTTTVGRPRDG